MQITFCELRRKNVINMVDGRCLGFITDLVMEDCSGVVLGLLVPSATNRFFNLFNCSQTFIPWQNICKIGEDVILVELCDSCGVSSCGVQTLDDNKKGKASGEYYKGAYQKENINQNPKNKSDYFKIYEM